MSHVTSGTLWKRLTDLVKWSVTLWAILLIASLVRLWISPEKHSVYPNFSEAASRWVHGKDLYTARRNYDFRYSPLVAIGFTPLLAFGNRIGGMIWCVFCTTLLVAALDHWLKKGAPRPTSGQERGAVFLLVLPLAIGNIASNQSNAPVLAMLLIAMTALQTEAFTTACLAIVVAFLFKLYPLSLGLILLLIYPRKLSGRLFVLVLAGLLLPYFFQRTAYVNATYRDWAHYLTVEDRSKLGIGRAYRDFQFLLHDLSIVITQRTYRIIELIVAAVFGVLCLMARSKQGSPARLNFFAFTLALCWMTVFGPATESMTYLLVAPVVCYLLVIGWSYPSSGTKYLYLLSYLFLLYTPFSGLFPGHSIFRSAHLKSIQPIAVLLLLAGVLCDAMGTETQKLGRPLLGSDADFDPSSAIETSRVKLV